MIIPDEFSRRVIYLKSGVSFFGATTKNFTKLLEEWPGSYTDILYESKIVGYEHRIIIKHVIVFETDIDAVAFKLKYGGEYV